MKLRRVPAGPSVHLLSHLPIRKKYCAKLIGHKQPLQKNFDVSVSFTGDMLKKITCSGSQNVCGKSAALLTTGEAAKHFYVRTSHEAGRRSQLPSCASCEDRGPTRCPPTAPRPAARLAAQRAPKNRHRRARCWSRGRRRLFVAVE